MLPRNRDPDDMNCEGRQNELMLFELKRSEMKKTGREGKKFITFKNTNKSFKAYKTTLFSTSVIMKSLNHRMVNLSVQMLGETLC